MPKTTSPDLIGSAEAAQLLHIDRSTFTRWVKRNRIKPVLSGTGKTGEKFFNRADVLALAPTGQPSSSTSAVVTSPHATTAEPLLRPAS